MFAALAGCTATGQVQYSGQVTAPNLVYVSPGVQVIADYDEPVFYNESFYWRFSGGVWYRSRHHTRDWVRVEVVPVAIRRIDRPTAYIRYRANARTEVRQPAPSPTVKDQRKDDSEEKELQKADRKEQKDERKEQKEVMKDERKDQKDERKEQKEVMKDERKDQKDERKEQKDERKEQKDERKEDRKNAKKPTR